MLGKQYNVREFIRLTPPQKQRLQKRDPEQYKKLCQKMETQYSKETDVEILTQMSTRRK